MTLNEKKSILQAFIVIFLIVFSIINWNEISWLFNYRVVSSLFSDFFQKENYQASSSGNLLENKEISAKENKESINKLDFEYSEKENSLEIPGLGISAPLVTGRSLDIAELKQDLDRGVVFYPDSVMPGEAGQTVILGHSAPENWPKIKYDWVFSEINNLEKGDRIFIYFNHKKYAYSVTDKIFLEKGEELHNSLTSNLNMLVLVSCWPPGKDYKRIAVEAELIIK